MNLGVGREGLIEGLKVPESSVANLRRIARGEIQSDEANRNIYSASSMSRYSTDDQYLDPASGVLKNRFGITEQVTLDATEASLEAVRLASQV